MTTFRKIFTLPASKAGSSSKAMTAAVTASRADPPIIGFWVWWWIRQECTLFENWYQWMTIVLSAMSLLIHWHWSLHSTSLSIYSLLNGFEEIPQTLDVESRKQTVDSVLHLTTAHCNQLLQHFLLLPCSQSPCDQVSTMLPHGQQ